LIDFQNNGDAYASLVEYYSKVSNRSIADKWTP